LSPADQGVELGRYPHVATAAVRAAHDGNDGGTPARAPESVECGEEVTRDGFPNRRAATLERTRGAVRQRSFPRELTIDL
jgi:hypothetical protein